MEFTTGHHHRPPASAAPGTAGARSRRPWGGTLQGGFQSVRSCARYGRDFFERFGATLRVSRAVEAGRQPSRTDLRAIGIEGPLPGLRPFERLE